MMETGSEQDRAILDIDLLRFLQILKVELEHLEAHTRILIDLYHERETRREVTEHVCSENVAVLRNEECGFCHFVRVLDKLDVTTFASLPALIDAIRTAFEREIQTAGLAHAAFLFADRKLRKVQHYVEASG